MRYFVRRLSWIGILGLCAPLDGRAADPVLRLKPNNFGRLHSLIRPQAKEDKWLQIPWLTDLWEARQKAAAAGKPILLWEMDGSPLACG